jgi:hypothetical protein
MLDWTKRLSLAALAAFFTGLFAWPVACGSILLINQHRFGDVDRGGPAAVLGGMAASAIVGCAVALLVWRKTRPR